MKEVTIYTDGACRGNPGIGGWGTILVWHGIEKELSGGEVSTTNNRMELTAAIEGLKALKEPCTVSIVTDSKYLCDGFTQGWVYGWEKKNWKKSDGSPALNKDLWEELLRLTKTHKVSFTWVHGHAGHEYNERCDSLATSFADSLKNGVPSDQSDQYEK